MYNKLDNKLDIYKFVGDIWDMQSNLVAVIT